MLKQKSGFITSVYYVQGLHCASCEILVEKKIIEIDEVEMVDVSLKKGTVTIEYEADKKITPEYLNKIFKDEGYCFSDKPFKQSNKTDSNNQCTLANEPTKQYKPFLIAAILILGYIFLSKTGLSSLVSVDAQSALPFFFLFGLLAGVSSCAALVGGIILSLSKQWGGSYQPHFLFNLGRVLGYAGLGAILGAAGSFFKMSPVMTASLVIAISVVMVILGLQMLGVKALKDFQIRLPKSLTGKIVDESNFKGKLGTFLMGALTFFLPCGFTITAQALALASGSAIQGGLIMGLFALGTLPGLLAIGIRSVKFQNNPKSAKQFSLAAGMLVLFFAAININSQLAVLGVANASDILETSNKTQSSQNSAELPPMIKGVQVVKIEASARGYSPKKIVMRANTPTRWEVEDKGTSGCTNAIISRSLFEGQIDLTHGKVSVKEFTAPAPGTYKYSCWMGMVTGTVEVVDDSGSAGDFVEATPPGSGGCGCGGGK